MGEFIDFLRERGLEPSVVRQIAIADWGRSLDIACCYNPYGTARAFRLLFRGCSSLNWEAVEDSVDVTESEVPIIGFETQADRRGVKPQREGDKVAVLQTTSMGLVISYTTFMLELP